MNFNIYVDGENHYLRSCEYWKKIHGDTISLCQAESTTSRANNHQFPPNNPPVIKFLPEPMFFWDNTYIRFSDRLTCSQTYPLQPRTAKYFSSCKCEVDKLHELKVQIRNNGFDPVLYKKIKDKSKMVDVALTTSMMEDAYNNVYDDCILFTSDEDFVALIEAVRRRGKKVLVAGYKAFLATNSGLLTVSDYFLDLGEHMKENLCKREVV